MCGSRAYREQTAGKGVQAFHRYVVAPGSAHEVLRRAAQWIGDHEGPGR